MTRRYREDAERIVYIGPHWVRRPQATPYHADWRQIAWDVVTSVVQVAVFLTLFLGIPFLLWLVAS